MKMTIDKAIDRLEDLHFEQDNWEYGELTEDCFLNREALQLAVNTMRKYQTMQEVLEKVWNVPSCMLDEAECLNRIMETYRTVRR